MLVFQARQDMCPQNHGVRGEARMKIAKKFCGITEESLVLGVWD
jgi:hypothetical protein